MSIDRFDVITVVGCRDTLIVSYSSGDRSMLLIICIDAPESTMNCLCSFGLRFREFSFVLQIRSANFVQLLELLQNSFSCTIFCPQRVIGSSVRKLWRVGVARMFRLTLDDSQRWSQLFPNVFLYLSSRRTRRSFATLLLDGLSHNLKSD